MLKLNILRWYSGKCMETYLTLFKTINQNQKLLNPKNISSNVCTSSYKKYVTTPFRSSSYTSFGYVYAIY